MLVDSEPKVVQRLVDTSSRTCIPCVDRHACLYEQSGRGNNWAWGYNIGRGYAAPEVPLWERAVNTVRRKVCVCVFVRVCVLVVQQQLIVGLVQLEATDETRDLSLWHSIGGGTGSGLGSRLAVEFKDAFPEWVPGGRAWLWFVCTPASLVASVVVASACGVCSCQLLSVAVAPHQRGETPLQHYNSMLCLWHVQQHADACLLFENDTVFELVHALKTVAGKRDDRVSTWDMNAAITQTVAQLLFPDPGPKGTFRPFDFAAFRDDLCPVPGLKFVTAHSATVNFDATKHRPSSSVVASTRAGSSAPTRRSSRGGGRRPSSGGVGAGPGAGAGAGAGPGAGARAAATRATARAPRAAGTRAAAPPSGPPKRTSSSARMRRGGPRTAQSALPVPAWCEVAAQVAPWVARRRTDGARPHMYCMKVYCRGAERADVMDHRAASRGDAPPPPPHIGKRAPPLPVWPGLPESTDWREARRCFQKALMLDATRLPRMSSHVVGGLGLTCTRARRSLTVCANGSATADGLRHCLTRVQRMFHARAYLHWYLRYGCEESAFHEAFEGLSDVMEGYDTGLVSR